MADIAVPTTIAVISPPSNPRAGLLAAAVGLFSPVYFLQDGSESYGPGDANDFLTVDKTVVIGLAIIGGTTGQYGLLVSDGIYDLGSASLVAGHSYYLSHNSGRIMPEGDLATGDKVVRVGFAPTTSQFKVEIENEGFVVP